MINMKIPVLLFAVLSIFSFSDCSNKNLSIDDQITDSVEHKNGLEKFVNFYNSDGKVVRTKEHYLDTVDNHWVLTGIDEFQYNESGQVVREEMFRPNLAMEISPLELDSVFYNDRGLKIESVYFVSGGKPDSWARVSRLSFNYLDNDTLVFSESQFTWDSDMKHWQKVNEKYYEYDSLGRVISLLTYQLDLRDTSKVARDLQEFYYPDDKLINENSL